MLINSAPNLASAVLDMTAFIICEMSNIPPLKEGSAESLERNQCPPARLLALREVAVTCGVG